MLSPHQKRKLFGTRARGSFILTRLHCSTHSLSRNRTCGNALVAGTFVPCRRAPNKSLDASGTSGLVIDNLSVTWLTAAASTQPFARHRVMTTNQKTKPVRGLGV